MLNQSSLPSRGSFGTVMSSLGHRQERRQTKESHGREGDGVGEGGTTGGLTKKTCRDDPQMAAENRQWKCFMEPQIRFPPVMIELV